MIIPIIQTIGVFISVVYGSAVILNMWRVKKYNGNHLFFFGIGVAMALCGIFF